MKEWFTAAEIAAAALPGMPRSASGIRRRAKRKNWPSRVLFRWPGFLSPEADAEIERYFSEKARAEARR